MSATDELRRLLDERGVEYEVDDAKTVMVTRWGAYGDWVSFIEYDNGDTKFYIDARRLTPAQAVEATLGRGTCHDTDDDEDRFVCSGCGCSSYIATVHMEFDEAGNKTDGWMDLNTPFFCPNCGKRVVDPTTNDADAEVAR